MSFIKRSLHTGFRRLGFDITRVPASEDAGGYPFAGIPYDPNSVPSEVYHRHYPAESIAERRFYNIGAGSFQHPYWTNIDLASDWYSGSQEGTTFINYDLFSLAPLPLPSGLAEAVYTSHTVEHVSDEACRAMFAEAYRILKPGGVFRMTTPNIALDLQAYRANDRDYFYWIDFYSHPTVCEKVFCKPFNSGSIQQIVLFNFATHLSQLALATSLPKVADEEFDHAFASLSEEDALDSFSHRCTIEAQRQAPGYHMNWWTEQKAIRMLNEAGFKTAHRCGYGQSSSPAMRDTILFDKQDPKISLYIEAVR